MKKWITLLCGLAVLFTSCKKEDINSETTQEPTITAKAASPYFASEWEKISNWEQSDSGNFRLYTSERSISELTSDVINNGVVVTYSKVSSSDPDFAMFTKPIMLPFYFVPKGERTDGSFYWYDVNKPGSIKLSYRVQFNKENPPVGGDVSLPDFQFRYFVISKAYLDSKSVDARTVKYFYTYQQLINFLGLHG